MNRSRALRFGIVGALAIAAGSSAVLATASFQASDADASSVVSIKAKPEFQDPVLLTRAWALPVASLYRPGFEYQRNRSFCGPTSLVDVMHSIDMPGRQDAVLDATRVNTYFGYLPKRMDLDELADVASTKMRGTVTVLRDLTLEQFREHLVGSNDPAFRYVVNFTRRSLFGEGAGHFSPIGGYLAAEDLVFVLDVNATYQPWLVRSERLYRAMNSRDHGAEKSRGLLRIAPSK